MTRYLLEDSGPTYYAVPAVAEYAVLIGVVSTPSPLSIRTTDKPLSIIIQDISASHYLQIIELIYNSSKLASVYAGYKILKIVRGGPHKTGTKLRTSQKTPFVIHFLVPFTM